MFHLILINTPEDNFPAAIRRKVGNNNQRTSVASIVRMCVRLLCGQLGVTTSPAF